MRKLPAIITIAGQEIRIIQSDTHYQDHGEFGSWHPKDNTIRIQSVKDGFSKDAIFATYSHEVTHAVLDLSGHTDLSSDEAFVERIGQLLFQAEKSRRYA